MATGLMQTLKHKLLFMIIGILVMISTGLMVFSAYSEKGMSRELMNQSLMLKLKGDIFATSRFMEARFGRLQYENGKLLDQNGVSLENRYEFVDMILENIGTTTTIFTRKGDDFERTITNIIKPDGSRAIGTMLGEDSAAYKTVMDKETYIGTALILGKEYLTAYKPILDAQQNIIGILYIGISQNEIMALADEEISEALLWKILFTVVIVIVAVIASIIFSLKVVKPINLTTGILEDISAGNGDLTKRLPVLSKDEIGTLSKQFNLFVDTLSGMISSVQNASETLEATGTDLAANMVETSSAIEEISANISSIRNQISSQAAGVTETTTTIEEITRSIESLNERIISQASAVSQSSAAVEEMIASINSISSTLEKNSKNVQLLFSETNEGQSHIAAVVTLVNELTVKAEDLVKANTIIQNIAGQTNLLAMNAAIEAAHAGEHGRGFAVVAEEIRNLAENSSHQSKFISAFAKDMHKAIESVVQSSEKTSTIFAGILHRVQQITQLESEILYSMEEQRSGGNEVIGSLASMKHITEEVQNGSDEMLTGSKMIMQEMGRIHQITSEIDQSISEINHGTNEINGSILQVTGLSTTNQEQVRSILDYMRRFKIS